MSGSELYQKNSVFLGFDEDYLFTLSSSRGSSDKHEDCALMIWDASSLGIPEKKAKIRKNHNAVLRNCVYPSLQIDPSDSSSLYVLVIAEYMPNSSDLYTGFLSYKLASDYSEFDSDKSEKKREFQYIDNTRYEITGAHNPSKDEWWATATKNDNSNYVLHYLWDSFSLDSYQLTSHGSNAHVFGKITGLGGIGSEFGGLTGYYTGSTASTSTNAGCLYSFSDLVGHVSKIETTGTCLTEASANSPSSAINISMH